MLCSQIIKDRYIDFELLTCCVKNSHHSARTTVVCTELYIIMWGKQ